MDDLDRLLAETMRDAAGRAPSEDGLLSTVHRRSGRLRRQRIATVLSAAAAVLAVSIPTVAVLMARSPAPGPAPAAVPEVSASPSPSLSPSPSPTLSRVPPAHTSAAPEPVTLAVGWKAPRFPYALAPVDGMRAPVASMEDGNLIGFFEATELRHHADTTITVSSREPASTGGGTSMAVRGHVGTLRTTDVKPARQLTLTWRESASRWIQLATDDTYEPQQVVALADGMTAASVAVLPPFELGLSPAGFATDTVTASTMTFRRTATAPGSETLKTVLRKRKQLTGSTVKVGRYQASLTHGTGGVTLDVDVTDWNATLEVTVGGGLTMSDADLLRFAAAVRVLNRSNPQ
jgi:hypothetical protein